MTDWAGASRTMIPSNGAQPSSGKMEVIGMGGPATGSSFSHVSPCRHPKYAAHAVPLVGGGDGRGQGVCRRVVE